MLYNPSLAALQEEFRAQVYVAAACAGLTGIIRVTSPYKLLQVFSMGSPG